LVVVQETRDACAAFGIAATYFANKINQSIRKDIFSSTKIIKFKRNFALEQAMKSQRVE
jgi:hypothetical protein